MKNQYVADINDYVKYALLRALAPPNRPVAVVWMLTAGDGRTDGRRLNYLGQPIRFRPIDPSLFDQLGMIGGSGRRSVAAVEERCLLPGAGFFAEPLHDDAHRRRTYFDRALAKCRGFPIIFFDPDNGFAVKSIPKGSRNSAKYLYWDELARTYERGHSVVVYQHFPRRPRLEFLHALAARIYEVTGLARTLVLQTAHVAFAVIPQMDCAEDLADSLTQFARHAATHMPVHLYDFAPADGLGVARPLGVEADVERVRPAVAGRRQPDGDSPRPDPCDGAAETHAILDAAELDLPRRDFEEAQAGGPEPVRHE